MSNIIKTTGDASPTLFSEKFQVHYHSIHGAWTETQVVFIEAGLRYLLPDKKVINILEIGFGTGLNCFATLIALPGDIKLNYLTVEKYPVTSAEVEQFQKELEWMDPALPLEDFKEIHSVPWDLKNEISLNFTLTKLKLDFKEIHLNEKVDLIYFDAFAPETQPELWTIEMFLLMADQMIQGGVLTTYCAKGYVKRNLKAAGFIVESLPGPPGKREITRAIKI